MKKNLTITMLMAILCCIALSAAAQPEKGRPGHFRELYKKADANEDGKITFEELKEVLPRINEERFKMMDKNSDGVLSKEDRPKPGDLIKKADKNEDGKVTFEELKDVAPNITQERFKKMDRNDDGVLTKEDIPNGPGHDQGHAPGRSHKFLKKADKNEDGKITFEEHSCPVKFF